MTRDNFWQEFDILYEVMFHFFWLIGAMVGERGTSTTNAKAGAKLRGNSKVG